MVSSVPVTPNPCKVYEDLYCLVLNCTAPPGEELDIPEICADPGHFENCGQTVSDLCSWYDNVSHRFISPYELSAQAEIL